jgi:hypothetical protein
MATEISLRRKELDPLSRSPKGKAGAGIVPPTSRHVPRPPKPLARPMRRLPPQEGWAPLRDPPIAAGRRCLTRIDLKRVRGKNHGWPRRRP